MIIQCSYINQNDLEYAIETLDLCKQDHAQKYGFNYPYFTPGGAYGKQWWQLDSSLALRGYQWVDREFTETSLLNFIESQREDGRICLWGADVLPSKVAGGNCLRQTEGISSLPKLFDVAYHIVKCSSDMDLKAATYKMMKRYLDWWFSERQDSETGLISAVFEETFIPYLGCAGEYAPVDTNVEVYVGCHYTSLLAAELGMTEDANALEAKKARLKHSINQYLWNEEKGAYFAYLIKEKRLSDCLAASTFFPLRMKIADNGRVERLIRLLKNQEHFNWDTIPLTSVSMKDSAFTTTIGGYQGNASWSGNVWTLINEMVVRGLCDCGEVDLAAELAFKTICAFNHNCAEFINPFDGRGHGVLQYGWTASQYLELIIEVIFGISYRSDSRTVTLSPKLPKQLKNECLSINGLAITNDFSIDIVIDHGEVRYSVSDDSVKVTVNCDRKSPFERKLKTP